jgi:sec-independent protein translocase protein TatB
MFPDLSWSHMLLVLVVALVVVGPKDLPKLMRKMGQWTAKARGMADQFRRSFDEMARQSELDELRKELDELRNTRPLAGVEEQINETLAGPAVSFEPETKQDAADKQPEETHSPAVEPEQAKPGDDQSAEPAHPDEPIPPGDQMPPPP